VPETAAVRFTTDAELVYRSINRAVFDRIPEGVHNLLDLGCGDGTLGRALKQQRQCCVVGVTHSEAEAAHARQVLDHVEVADLDRFDPGLLGQFDCIVCSHLLEHLQAPQRLLTLLRPCLTRGGTLLIALPNALFWRQRIEFIRGRFRYTDGGLMDRTHLRFFDWDTGQDLAQAGGFKVRERVAEGGLPLSRLLGRAPARALDRWAISTFPGLFGFQFVLCCEAVRG